jgi:uncharacterized protein (DUF433 family)
MQLEEYFDFLSPDDIRIKGHRIGIEDVLYEYIHNAMTPDELAVRFPTLTLEEIYATLLYYVRNKAAMDQYLADWLEHGRRMWQAPAENLTPVMVRLRQLRTEREAQRTQPEPA